MTLYYCTYFDFLNSYFSIVINKYKNINCVQSFTNDCFSAVGSHHDTSKKKKNSTYFTHFTCLNV